MADAPSLPESNSGSPEDLPPSLLSKEQLRELLLQIADTHMPFGKYGPQAFPPQGVPLHDLPVDYLHWFAAKGFPKGKLGKLMGTVYQLKCDGADPIFDSFRKAKGGRHPLRRKRQREFTFDDDNDENDG